MIKKLFIAALACFGIATAAYAAGLWQGYPVAGGPSYCNSIVNGVCNQTIAAAPETSSRGYIPSDSGLPGGQTPQTVLIPTSVMGGGVQSVAPLTGASIVVSPGVANLILTPAGTIATATVTLPAAANLFNGQKLYIITSQTVTALTLTAGSGTTVNGTNTTVTAAAPLSFIYNQAALTWIKIP